MKIYTRTGDGGETSLLTGERVAKDELRLEALGEVDELVAALGVAKAETAEPEVVARVAALQGELYRLMADLACAGADIGGAPAQLPGDAVDLLETAIDDYEAHLPPLKDFVMPGDTRASAALHLARTVCRRAERRVLSAARAHTLATEIPRYLNRLSDLLFVMARFVDRDQATADTTFKSQQ
ncbi:MAG: cob(I)yrinic acid a,c-diamide adenosyltransferase [Pseudomonadota bacterium]